MTFDYLLIVFLFSSLLFDNSLSNYPIIPALPRSSAPLRSLCLVPDSAFVAITSRWARLVPHRDHRSVNAPTHCQSQSCRHRRGASHRVYPSQPHEPKLVAFAATFRYIGVFPTAHDLPLVARCPTQRKRRFRSTPQPIPPAAPGQKCHTYCTSPQSKPRGKAVFAASPLLAPALVLARVKQAAI